MPVYKAYGTLLHVQDIIQVSCMVDSVALPCPLILYVFVQADSFYFGSLYLGEIYDMPMLYPALLPSARSVQGQCKVSGM